MGNASHFTGIPKYFITDADVLNRVDIIQSLIVFHSFNLGRLLNFKFQIHFAGAVRGQIASGSTL